MFGWLAAVILRRSIRRINAGDIGPMLAGYANDAVLVFPGDNSWGGEHRGRDAIKAFLERFARVGVQFQAQEIMVSGWPWNATLCVVFRDHAKDADGNIVYENHGVIYGRTRWGKIVFQEDFEDTTKVAAFDRWLSLHEPKVANA
jgi:ketosteroid isomerase-like protein